VQHDLGLALDKDGVLWGLESDRWVKRERSAVRTFAVRTDAFGGEHLVTAHTDGTVRIARPARWDGPETGDTLVVPGLADVVAVAAVDFVMTFHMGGKNLMVDRGCALDRAGAVTCWDGNFKVYPTKLTGTHMTDALLVCTLDAKRQVHCALPYESYMQTPQHVRGLDGAKQIAGASDRGDGRVCGVFDDGSVACADLKGPRLSEPKVLPAQKIDGLPPADEVAVGPGTVYARLRDGRVMSWGSNDRAQLGDGTWFDRNAPVAVANLLDEPLPPPSDGAGNEPDDGPTMSWAGVPAACAHDEEITIGDRTVRVVSAYAWIRDGTFGVRLASFRLPLDWGLWIRSLRGSQRFLELGQRRNRRGPPFAKGTYRRNTTFQVWGKTVTSERTKDLDETGLVLEATLVSNDWICGKITLTGQTTPISFAARRIDGR